MQQWQTTDHLAYQNIYGEILYDGTPMSDISQHMHPTDAFKQLGLRQSIQELKSINNGHPAFFAK